ncbi:MAG: beta-propeller fold lactonase family protein [bacterium]|nr:beta-propeller fold lactonase family protein [bacterium]MDE0352953.1 beta-propeller fold lactonase family protein [bacterium]
MPVRFRMLNSMRVRVASRFVAASVALLLGFLAPVYPVGAAGKPLTDIAPFGTMVVNGFLVPIPRPKNDQLVMHPVARIAGDLAPKSVVASGTGLYLAQNMMYRHTISVLDHTKRIVKTIDDSVNLREFGYDASGDIYRGAPVEAAFTSDGSFAFVSNYRMYGPGYDSQAGSDTCGKDQGQDSFVYRIDATALEIDRVYPVGPVPKHLAVTPDNRLLVVSNWCGFDVTVIDLVTHETLAEIDVGRHPRGVAVTGDGRTAYVAVMGSTGIAAIDLSAFSPEQGDTGTADQPALTYIRDVGISPRHLVLSPDGKTLYATLNGEDAVVAVDLDSGQVVRRVRTGQAPRSMDISADGTALYVVNYRSHTVSKIRTRDFMILQEFDTTPRPIGITYDPFNNEVWVSTYTGTIHVFAEQPG